jgi:hypothetical protein
MKSAAAIGGKQTTKNTSITDLENFVIVLSQLVSEAISSDNGRFREGNVDFER